jgi:hypothetical protein
MRGRLALGAVGVGASIAARRVLPSEYAARSVALGQR